MEAFELPAYARSIPKDQRLPKQVRPLYRDTTLPLAFGVLLALFLVILLWPACPHAWLLGWLSAIVVVSGLRTMLVAAYDAQEDPLRHAALWLNRFAVGTGISGAVWGSTVLLFGRAHAEVHLLLAAVWPCGVAAGATAAFSFSRRVLFAFLIPALLPGGLYLILHGGQLYLALGAGTLLYLLFLSSIGLRIYGNHLQRIALEIYNGQLVDDVMAKNEQIAALNDRLRDLLHERTASLVSSDAKYRTLFDSAYDAIILFQGDRCIDCNAKAPEMFGCAREDLIGRTPADFAPQFQPDGVPSAEKALALINSAFTGSPQYVEWRCKRPDGSLFDAEVGMNVVTLADGSHVQAIVRDITERRKAQEGVRRLAYFDTLTGLPNLASLRERLDEVMAAAREKGRVVPLLVLDIARFGEINVALGYAIGDHLLQLMAQRLREQAKSDWMVARLGASVFGILQCNASTEAEAVADARALISALQHTWTVDDLPIDISIHAGLAAYPAHAPTSELLLRHAEAAKTVSRERWSGLVVYEPAFDVDPSSLSLIAELRSAIESGGLTLFYQPKLTLARGSPCGVEALVRWQHPTQGFLGPEKFIPLAEKTGLITDLTLWAVRKALEDCCAWRKTGFEGTVSVNVSTRDLYQKGFAEKVAELVGSSGAEPGWLILEITESVLMEDPDFSAMVLNEISEQGILLSLDDFGTGYSSLAYLARLPIRELKIDRSFIADLHHSTVSTSIVRSTIGLAHDLGLTVTAEGIEDEWTMKVLKLLKCDEGQGYGISAPLPVGDLMKWLAQRRLGTAQEAR